MNTCDEKQQHTRDAANLIIFFWQYKKLISSCSVIGMIAAIVLKVTANLHYPSTIFANDWIISFDISDNRYNNEYLNNSLNSRDFLNTSESIISNNRINSKLRGLVLKGTEASKNLLQFAIKSNLKLDDTELESNVFQLLSTHLENFEKRLYSDFNKLDESKTNLGKKLASFNKAVLNLLNKQDNLSELSRSLLIQSYLSATLREELWEQAAYTVIGDNILVKDVPKIKSFAKEIESREIDLKSDYGVAFAGKIPQLQREKMKVSRKNELLNSFLDLNRTVVWVIVGFLSGFVISIFIAFTHIFIMENANYMKEKLRQ